jgi:lysozyme
MTQTMSQSGLRFTTACERKVLKAYPDKNGVWTIGVGHTKGVKPNDLITNAQAMQYLLEDMATAEKAVLGAIKNPLPQHQFDMLVDITFNSGPGFVNSSETQGAICGGNKASVAGLILWWALDNGVIEDGLLKRAAMRGRIYQQGYSPANMAWIDKHK